MNEDSSVFIAYLRFEANMAAERARQLREMADRLEADIREADVEVDENGIPKYKGKKRGRKPKKRKRQRNPNASKRQHNAYTLFVQTIYPEVRTQNPHLQSKEVISIVAKQWAKIPDSDKKIWNDRAKSYSAMVEDEGVDDSQEVNDDDNVVIVDTEDYEGKVIEENLENNEE